MFPSLPFLSCAFALIVCKRCVRHPFKGIFTSSLNVRLSYEDAVRAVSPPKSLPLYVTVDSSVFAVPRESAGFLCPVVLKLCEAALLPRSSARAPSHVPGVRDHTMNSVPERNAVNTGGLCLGNNVPLEEEDYCRKEAFSAVSALSSHCRRTQTPATFICFLLLCSDFFLRTLAC